ncbi:hypothetical protein [Candidatus Nitrospira bockiana]
MVTTALFAGLCLLGMASLAQAQRAILPHGDPTVEANEPSEAEEQRREDIRERRLHQQGQGPHYRIEGEPQPRTADRDAGEEGMAGRQETGISDPTVNPGQAAGTRVIEGLVLHLEEDGVVLRDPKGKEIHLLVDHETTGDRELKPGDRVTTRVTGQGRAITITKQPAGASPDR